jgi:hypothetical protein
MAWTTIPNANLDVGAPIRSVDILAIRDNITALANGDTGAPPIKAAAFGSGQSGNAPIFAPRAWVNFDGTGTFTPNPSTSKIRASGNVSSITKNTNGDYTINFTTALPDANYGVMGMTTSFSNSDPGGYSVTVKSSGNVGSGPSLMTSSQFNILVGAGGGSRTDAGTIAVCAIR